MSDESRKFFGNTAPTNLYCITDASLYVVMYIQSSEFCLFLDNFRKRTTLHSRLNLLFIEKVLIYHEKALINTSSLIMKHIWKSLILNFNNLKVYFQKSQ